MRTGPGGAARRAAGPLAGVTAHRCSIFSAEVTFAVTGPGPGTPFGALEDRLRDYERRFSRFRDDNELAALNSAGGRWVEVSAELHRLLRHALTVSVDSRGLVNIAVTGALRKAGYVRPWPQEWAPPDGADPVPVPPLGEVLELRDGRARLRPGHEVDFGGIAKGLWADDAVNCLGSDAAASLGGDISARGAGPGGDGWPIGLPNGRTVVVRDGGVATSGTGKRRSGRAHHVIDPRTGRPSRSGLREVSVVAGTASTAEWVATALLVGGSDATDLLDREDVLEWIPIDADAAEVPDHDR